MFGRVSGQVRRAHCPAEIVDRIAGADRAAEATELKNAIVRRREVLLGVLLVISLLIRLLLSAELARHR